MRHRWREIPYGPGPEQVGELWLPRPRPARGHCEDPLPVVVLVHGGFWRTPYTKRLMHRLAADVTRRGWAAWNVEYRRLGRFGGGGGWPATFVDVADAVDHLATLPEVDASRAVVCGHSAGSQLAWWCLGRRRVPAAPGPGVPVGGSTPVTVLGAVSLAGVLDLDAAARLGLGAGAVPALLNGTPEEVPDRYAAASPMARLPLGVEQVIVHGDRDAVVPTELSDRYAKASADAGDPVVLEPVPGAGHLSMIDPGRAGWKASVAHIERLLA